MFGELVVREYCGRATPTELEGSYLANIPETQLGALRGNVDRSRTSEKKKMCRVMDEVARSREWTIEAVRSSTTRDRSGNGVETGTRSKWE
jgi:hypothetical protein